MSKVLSYYHAKLRTANRLIDVQYLLLIPLLQVSVEVQTTEKVASPGSVASLVEQYITLLESRPSFVRDAWGEVCGCMMLWRFLLESLVFPKKSRRLFILEGFAFKLIK